MRIYLSLILANFVSFSQEEDFLAKHLVYDALKTATLPLLNFSISDGMVDKEMLFKSYELPALKSPPRYYLPNDTNTLYSVMLIDLDNFANKTIFDSFYVYWLIINIDNGDSKAGRECIPYTYPFPPINTGFHRVIALLFKQAEKTNCKPINQINPGSSKERGNRKLEEFKQLYNLEGPLMASGFFVDSNILDGPFPSYQFN